MQEERQNSMEKRTTILDLERAVGEGGIQKDRIQKPRGNEKGSRKAGAANCMLVINSGNVWVHDLSAKETNFSALLHGKFLFNYTK